MSDPMPDAASNVPPKPDAPPADSQAPPPAHTALLPVAQTQDDKTMGMICHFLGIILGIIGPLIIWLIKKDQSKFVDDQGKEALNFQLTLLIGDLIGFATVWFCVGGFIIAAVYIIRIIFCILAA